MPNSKTASHLQLNNVVLDGIKPYITQNSVFLGDHSTACIGPSLPKQKNFYMLQYYFKINFIYSKFSINIENLE